VVRPPGLLPRPLRDVSCARAKPARWHQTGEKTHFHARLLFVEQRRICRISQHKVSFSGKNDRLAFATRQAGGGNETGWRPLLLRHACPTAASHAQPWPPPTRQQSCVHDLPAHPYCCAADRPDQTCCTAASPHPALPMRCLPVPHAGDAETNVEMQRSAGRKARVGPR